MIYIKPKYKQHNPTLISKTFSYTEVENILMELIEVLNLSEVIDERISASLLENERGIKVTARNIEGLQHQFYFGLENR
ncbi:MAG: hypothetical protein J6A25_07465 [Lachnospiraceae bacterium]|nr:hypothetical protein [Lachnospiraceae bacterium]